VSWFACAAVAAPADAPASAALTWASVGFAAFTCALTALRISSAVWVIVGVAMPAPPWVGTVAASALSIAGVSAPSATAGAATPAAARASARAVFAAVVRGTSGMAICSSLSTSAPVLAALPASAPAFATIAGTSATWRPGA
jgi:hypothetical protein